MSGVTPHLTYKEQIERLINRGCIIADKTACEDILRNVGYYRFSAYFLPYKTTDDKYKNSTTLDKAYGIYEFDRELRLLLFSAVEEIEVSLRARLAHFHSGRYGPLGYIDPDSFNRKHDANKFRNSIERVIENNKKNPFVRHHIENYGGVFPLWVICELFTFGMTSYFYNDLKTADKKAFDKINYKNITSWLRCCTDLRNICAHYGRLYFRIFSAVPSGFCISEQQKRRLWSTMLAVRALFPFPQKWNTEFIPQLQKLFERYKNYIDLRLIAFPDDWAQQLMRHSVINLQ